MEGLKERCVCKRDTDCREGMYCDAGTDLNLNASKLLKVDNETGDLVCGGHQCKSGYCKFSRCCIPISVPMAPVSVRGIPTVRQANGAVMVSSRPLIPLTHFLFNISFVCRSSFHVP